MQLKTIYKRLLIVSGKILFLAFAIISMAFVNNEYKKKKIEVINIKIHSDNQPMMCSVEDVENYLKKTNIDLNKKYYYEIDFNEVEKIIGEKEEIKNADIYFTADRQLFIEVNERKPIARIVFHNQHYYIDDEWKTMKVVYPYRVPLVMINSYEHPEVFKDYSISKIFTSKTLTDFSVFDDIYIVLKTLQSDTLLSKLIDYVYIDKNHEIKLYPLIGKFVINAGNSEYFPEKINKFKLFIFEGLNKNDAWNRYSEINLKYKNLIYCTKK
ncbi:MAG: hypothetical protein KatS3mg027_0196 [Bacteroidia bacterium]|nr:MAG: hypothetical protein KatS3mg027_0196 [Bacteroidia bacterium]